MAQDTTAEYDIIFAGGGTCACVTAGRLAAASPELKILLIESGKNTKGLPDIVQPARFPIHLAPDTTTLSFHPAKPSPALDRRSLVVPVARCVGGGSSVNFLMYTRASASDYDDWETVHENPGWGSKDLISLAEKLETYEIDPTAATHGADGPLKISHGSKLLNVGESFLEMAKSYEPARGLTGDVNDFHTSDKFGRWAKYIDKKTGTRSDVVHNYIYDQAHDKNIFILENARVKRVIFEGTKAVGVEWVPESQAHSETASVHTIKAKHLVVLSAGALSTPAILERSGIGAMEVLKKNDVACLVDLKGVGEGYMDHNGVLLSTVAAPEAECIDEVLAGNKEHVDGLVAQWKKDGSTILAHNGIDAGIKFRPNEKDLEVIGPAFSKRWEEYFANALDKPIMWMGVLATAWGVPRDATNNDQKYFTMDYFLDYPVSRGYAHITSGKNPFAPLDFHPGFLDDPADVAVLRFGYKKAREWARRMSLFRGEFPGGHPSFSGTSNAKVVAKRDGPFPLSEPEIVYCEEDDQAIDAFVRRTVATTWHSLGTCAMKPREKGGVVDPALNVYGVQGLKIADGSICPGNVGANTNNTVIIIGEKAAGIIAAELGIKL